MNLGRIAAPEATMSLEQVVQQLRDQEGSDALRQLAEDQLRSG